MKQNYFIRGLKNGLRALAFLCVFGYASVNAQTETVEVVIKAASTSSTVTYHGIDSPYTMTGKATLAGGATFDVSFIVLPASGQTIAYNNVGWGANTGGTIGNVFRGTGSATAFSITFSNFTGGMSQALITAYTFLNATIINGNGASDKPSYATKFDTFTSPYAMSYNPQTINLLTYGPPLAGISSYTSLDQVRVFAHSGSTSDSWTVGDVSVRVTVNTASLGTKEVTNVSNNELIISPNPVVNTISLNMPIQSAEVIDMAGRTLKVFTAESKTYDVSDLSSGSYILKGVSSVGNAVVKRFIKK